MRSIKLICIPLSRWRRVRQGFGARKGIAASIVRSFGYSVVIYSSVIPGYVLGGYLVEWLDRKYAILLDFVSITVFGTLFGRSQSSAQITTFAGLTVFFLSIGSTAIYTYTPEVYPTEIRATAMGIAFAWGRVGPVTMLLVFGRSLPP